MGPAQTAPTPERLDAFKKTMIHTWNESIAVVGIPPDAIYQQVFSHASSRGLPAEGRMVDFGAGPSFMPTEKTMREWMDSYFGDLKKLAEQSSSNNMPEA